MSAHMNGVYIIGGAQTDFERNWTKEGKGVIALMRELVADGLKDSGVSYDDIRQLNAGNRVACFVGNFLGEKYNNQAHLGSFLTEVDPVFYGVPSARYEAACASGSAAIDAASARIKTGDYDLAIVLGWEMMKAVDSQTGGDYLGQAAYYEKEAQGVEFPFPKLFARLVDEAIGKYRLEEKLLMDMLAQIAVKNYTNAKRNPHAQTRKWFMSYNQAASRGSETNPLVGGKLAVSDCSQVTDGGALVILAAEEYVKKRGIKAPFIKGYGHRVAPILLDKKIAEASHSPFVLPWTRQAVLEAYQRAGMTIDDIDFIETHDCFTISEYLSLSAFGITEPGKEYQAIEQGLTAFNGRIPVNPSGGLIGCGHPVG
ncbi:MAG: acetyl-CoA acetyltransferase, partial [Dehalococcoidales bacterium]|nr:acetyl-CoA acetyltransferase [Dehalococcoidales bacterium]